ncbi:MAG TPA: four helix bundle protein [bacterium]|nr:four helix bundle protein [bacterium]HNS33786.1 four helix bundle protein [bacterium]HNZ73711.1 four helix bundle protein [bacterium]HOH66946.1 four helix bundle protein [bacterium]HQA63909.1 four helix bundle protein [bacterium]
MVLDVYKITEQFLQTEIFGLVSQLRRAASSITANIAEGFERYHFKDKIKFYYQSRGSAAEVQNFLILSRDLGFITFDDYKNMGQRAKQVMQILNGLIRATADIME